MSINPAPSGEAGFGDETFVARPARRDEIAEMQAFNAANPEYWLLTHGHVPPPDDVAEAFDWRPPSEMPYSSHTMFLVRDARTRAIAGHVACTADLLVRHVYHLAFFLIETRRRGTGFAQHLYSSYERWTIEQGARWLRLCAVAANERAVRFWRGLGYGDLWWEAGFELGTQSHTLIRMVKPLGGRTLAQYRVEVPQDKAKP